MARVHAFEIADLDGVPASLRQYLSEFLGFLGGLSKAPYGAFAKRLAEALQHQSVTQVVELCAGHGGPSRQLVPLLAEHGVEVAWTLTDLRPPAAPDRAHVEAKAPVTFAPSPVDATQVPAAFKGFRVVCNAFHHFRPPLAKAILEDAIANGEGIAVMEVTARHPLPMFSILFAPLNAILMLPFLKPFRISRWLWGLSGIGPLVVLFDGLVSCLRVYSPAELDALVADLPGRWESGRLPMKGPGFITYLIGVPVCDPANPISRHPL